MSNIVTHTQGKKDKKNRSLFVVFITLIIVLAILFGLNYFINKNNKNNLLLDEKPVDSSYTMGQADAKIKLVEYSDFQCPACRAFNISFPEVYKYINDKYGSSTLSLTYKYFPLVQIHRNALLSANSAEAARLQGKFWDLGEILFQKQDEWGEALDAKSKIEGYARDLGLDMAKFVQDRDSQEAQKSVNDGLTEATKLGLNHTPTVFMNGLEMINLDLSVSGIEAAIENRLKELNIEPIATTTNNL